MSLCSGLLAPAGPVGRYADEMAIARGRQRSQQQVRRADLSRFMPRADMLEGVQSQREGAMQSLVATRTELLDRRRRALFVAEGRDLLKDKRTALVREFRQHQAELLDGLDELRELASRARRRLVEAIVVCGPEPLESGALVAATGIRTELRSRTVAGVRVYHLRHDPVRRDAGARRWAAGTHPRPGSPGGRGCRLPRAGARWCRQAARRWFRTRPGRLPRRQRASAQPDHPRPPGPVPGDRDLGDRRTHHARAWSEAPDLLRLGAPRERPRGADRRPDASSG